MSDFELILMCALRYALGRRTYIVGVVADYITKELPNLSNACISNIIKDIDESRTNFFGDSDACDKESWTHLWAATILEREKRIGPDTSQ